MENTENCLYCGRAVMAPWLSDIEDRRGIAAGTWAFAQCEECRSAMLSPVPTPQALLAYYPQVYSFAVAPSGTPRWKRWLSRLEHALLYAPMYRRDAKVVCRNVVGHNTGGSRSLLDIGCGRGLRLLAFRDLGFDVHGVDFQQEVVDYVRCQLHLPATCSDVEGLDGAFAPESFDVITAYYVVEHLLDVRQFLEKCKRLLKPGGCLVAAVPFSDSVQASLFRSKWSQVTEAPRHVSLPSRKGMRILASRVGLEEVRVNPDSLRNCAAAFSLSLVPGSATHASYGSTALSLIPRLLGTLLAAAATPWCLIESGVLGRPAMGVIFAWKPRSN